MKRGKALVIAAAVAYAAEVIFIIAECKTPAYVTFILASLLLVIGRSEQKKEKDQENQ